MITIKNPDTFQTIAIQEELFHAYQNSVYAGGTAQYAGAPGSANIEFEAKVTADILGLFTGTGSVFAVQGSQAYLNWLDSVTNNETSYPTSFTQSQLNDYFGFMQDFVNTNSSYSNTQVKPDLNPQAIFSLINKSGCAH